MLLLFISLLLKNHFIQSSWDWPNVQIHFFVAVITIAMINIVNNKDNNKDNNMGDINISKSNNKTMIQILWSVLLSVSGYLSARKLGLKQKLW